MLITLFVNVKIRKLQQLSNKLRAGMNRVVVISLLFLMNAVSAVAHIPNSPSESVEPFIITDSLINAQLDTLSVINTAAVGIGTIPVSVLNAILWISTDTPAGILTFPILFYKTIALPFITGGAVYRNQRLKIRQNLIKTRSDSRPVDDRSHLKNKHPVTYSIYSGVDISEFETSNVYPGYGFTIGVQHRHPINRYFAVSSRMDISRQSICLKDKLYQNKDIWAEDRGIYTVDINYSPLQIYSPLFLTFTWPLENSRQVYGGIGAGASMAAGGSWVKKDSTSAVSYDYSTRDTWIMLLNLSNPRMSANIGYSIDKWFVEAV